MNRQKSFARAGVGFLTQFGYFVLVGSLIIRVHRRYFPEVFATDRAFGAFNHMARQMLFPLKLQDLGGIQDYVDDLLS